MSFCAPRAAYGKCVAGQIKISGEVEGVTNEVVVKIEAVSTPQVSESDVRQEILWHGAQFEVNAWFDTYSGMSGDEHKCDRRPQIVTVILSRGKVVLERRVRRHKNSQWRAFLFWVIFLRVARLAGH